MIPSCSSPSQVHQGSSASCLAANESFLRQVDRRLERRNRRILSDLTVWAEILDALGWQVALRLPDGRLFFSSRASTWIAARSLPPDDWGAIASQLRDHPPARLLISKAQLLVWAEVVPVASPPCDPSLTKREAEVLAWLHQGKTGPEIAVILGCAPRTVESHVARLYRKLGIHDRAQLHFSASPLG